METVTYKGKEYPTRTLKVSIEGDERDITIATQELSNAMGVTKENVGTEEENIDSDIYFYVDNEEILGLEGTELCRNWLDEPMEFISEDHEDQFSIQDLDEGNKTDLEKWIYEDQLLGLIDEETGGIIGYINHAHAKRIMVMLNEIPYLKNNLRKLN